MKDSKLIFHKDRADLKTHIVSIPLRGCEVIPGLDSKHPLTFRLLRNGQEVAVLEVRDSLGASVQRGVHRLSQHHHYYSFTDSLQGLILIQLLPSLGPFCFVLLFWVSL